MRHINDRFIYDLLYGELSFFLQQVKMNSQNLTLQIRDGYVNIYYRGGNLLKIEQKSKGYRLYFDPKYYSGEKIQDFVSSFSLMISYMDTWFAANPKPEREFQQKLLMTNPEIIDVEYQINTGEHRMRFDMLAVHNDTLVVIENKFGNGAIGGNAGLKKHYDDMCFALENEDVFCEIQSSVIHITDAKKQLGLIDKDIVVNPVKTEILFILADYNQRSIMLQNELDKMNGKTPVGILMMDSNTSKISYDDIQKVSVV